jgi:hypothetical protein
MKRPLCWCIALIACLTLAGADSPGWNSYLGNTPPELVSQKEQWVNTTDALRLEDLRGKVVWLTFNF